MQVQRQTAAEEAAAEAGQLELQEQEWNMAELERIQEQQVQVLESYAHHRGVTGSHRGITGESQRYHRGTTGVHRDIMGRGGRYHRGITGV